MGYLTTTQIQTAIIRLASAYRGLCELVTLPHVSWEGRTSFALRIGRAGRVRFGREPAGKPGVLFTGCVHAREWGGAEICLAFAADLLWAYEHRQGLGYGGTRFTARDVATIVDRLDVFVFPLVNPDGRTFSQSAPEHADWRRNRRAAPPGQGPHCAGVDVNRNHDFVWDFRRHFAPGALHPGLASDDPCAWAQTYHGPAPASEPETRNIDWLLDEHPGIARYMDIHSYGEVVLYPWGNDQNQAAQAWMNFTNPAFDGARGVGGDAYGEYLPGPDQAAVIAIAERVRDAVNGVRGGQYRAMQGFAMDTTGRLSFPTSGAGDDYATSRHLADQRRPKVYGFTLEFGKPWDFVPPWAEMDQIILDVNAGMVEFCLGLARAAAPVWPDGRQSRRLFPWEIWGPMAGAAAVVLGAVQAIRAIARRRGTR